MERKSKEKRQRPAGVEPVDIAQLADLGVEHASGPRVFEEEGVLLEFLPLLRLGEQRGVVEKRGG